jgi:hypothetical protein
MGCAHSSVAATAAGADCWLEAGSEGDETRPRQQTRLAVTLHVVLNEAAAVPPSVVVRSTTKRVPSQAMRGLDAGSHLKIIPS